MRFLLVVLSAIACAAEPTVYPPDAGVIDLTQPPYNLDKTGVIDCTEVLSNALITNKNTPAILWLPNGIYKVTGTVDWAPPPAVGPILVGESRAGVEIRLPANTPGFEDANAPRRVLDTGFGVAQNFFKGIVGLTVRVGAGNPGATAIHFETNNTGILDDVSIISDDGAGFAGIDVRGGENGPCLVRNVSVQGFGYGLVSDALNAIAVSQLTVTGQSIAGVLNTGGANPLWIEGLTSVNSVPAVINGPEVGHMTLINSSLTGGSPSVPAIRSRNNILARNVITVGYQRALEDQGGARPGVPDAAINEYGSQPLERLFSDSSPTTLNLPIEFPPEPARPTDFSQWANWRSFEQPGRSDAQALQAAIDSGKPVVYLPYIENFDDRFQGNGATVYLRGNVSRLEGCTGFINGDFTLIIEEGTAPVVKLSRILNFNGDLRIINRSSRTVVMEFLRCNELIQEGSGKLFLTDACGENLITRNPLARVWARHFNAERPDQGIRNEGGQVWVFGWKTESNLTKIRALAGRTEVLGFLHYASGLTQPEPMIIVQDGADLTVGSFRETNFFAPGLINTYVRETRAGETRTLLPEDTDGRQWSLFTATSTAPSIQLTGVVAQQQFRGVASIALGAVLGGSWPTLARVEWYDGGAKLGEDSTAPYSFTWSDPPTGASTITARGVAIDGTTVSSLAVPIAILPPGYGDGLKGDFFTNRFLAEPIALTRVDPVIDFPFWPSEPAAGIPSDNFSIRWTGRLVAPFAGEYTFFLVSDDGSRLWVNDQQLVDQWVDQGPTERSGVITLAAGQSYPIRIEFYEAGGGATCVLRWSHANLAKQTVPQDYLFSTTAPPPPPLTGYAIGSQSPAGSSSFEASTGRWSVSAAGRDIWNRNDAFRLVAQDLTGDGNVTAQVISQTNTNRWAKAGVMMRDGSAANARHAMTVVTPTQGVVFQRRTTTGGSSASSAGTRSAAPRWLRVKRVGNALTGQESPDGTTWRAIGTTSIAMPTTVKAGLCVTSHANGTLSTAVFANVTVTPSGGG